MCDIPNVETSVAIVETTTSCIKSNLKLYILGCGGEREINLTEKLGACEDIEIVVKEILLRNECRKLVLKSNNITAEGAREIAEALKKNTRLEKLDLGYNKIGDNGTQYLADALSNNNRTLIKLHLQSNSITAVGARYLAEMLKNNRAIRRLGLDYNNIGDQGIQALSHTLYSNSIEMNPASNWRVRNDDFF